ncbi:MAG: phytanoyl-CoA dioxygenase family protein [Gammaproteobacteria bacterium]|nr:phytanoyl-CoA dioxygenase family protein [Gammaproteobacteria bacterium]
MAEQAFYDDSSCDIESFHQHLERAITVEGVPRAVSIESNIPIYRISDLADDLTGAARQKILAEWFQVLSTGPGVLVLSGLMHDTEVVDEASEIFQQILAEEAQASAGEGDHFAAAGSNSRIWNSAQKLCLKSPEVFARYFANVALSAVCEAWLGPGYQMTAQLNVVHPGGIAQDAHRDYHLGFQPVESMKRYPSHVHALSPALTLQGAVAHCDMPLESGPTKLLPFSQTFGPGYVAMKRPEFQAYFEQYSVQLPLNKGDGLFFNPALFHAAGDNISPDIERMANLLQISSAFGRAMESLDREAMSRSLYPALLGLRGNLNKDCLHAAIAACAEGYSFPTNLDKDPPLNGMAPTSQVELMKQAVAEGWDISDFESELLKLGLRKVT